MRKAAQIQKQHLDSSINLEGGGKKSKLCTCRVGLPKAKLGGAGDSKAVTLAEEAPSPSHEGATRSHSHPFISPLSNLGPREPYNVTLVRFLKYHKYNYSTEEEKNKQR